MKQFILQEQAEKAAKEYSEPLKNELVNRISQDSYKAATESFNSKFNDEVKPVMESQKECLENSLKFLNFFNESATVDIEYAQSMKREIESTLTQINKLLNQ